MTYEAQLADALSAVEARPPAAYLWFGQRFAAPGLALTDAIRDRLIGDFHATGAARPPRTSRPAGGGDGGEFARALSLANRGRGAWQGGWRIGAAGDDGIDVRRPDGLRLLAPPEDVRDAEVRLPKELLASSPGTYVALGDTPGPAGALARLSWHIAPEGAVTLAARATYALNGAGLPFRIELLNDPARYARRRDAAALLVARGDFPAVLALLRPLLRALGPHLADGAPALTKPLTRGLAVAEEPEDGQSFAAHRCGLLAGAVVAAGERGLRDPRERLALAYDAFAAAGLSLDAPYLQPGSADAYA